MSGMKTPTIEATKGVDTMNDEMKKALVALATQLKLMGVMDGSKRAIDFYHTIKQKEAVAYTCMMDL